MTKCYVLLIFKDLYKMKKSIQQKLFLNYNLTVSNKWLDKYLFFFAHCTLSNPMTIIQAIEEIDNNDINLLSFAYFIMGYRAMYNLQKGITK